MVDLVITPASVLATGDTSTRQGSAGEALTAGKVVYLDSATGTYKLADSNGAAALRSPVGIALNGASAGQPVMIALSGPVTIGATLTPGVACYLSDTPGGICPVADVGAGEYATVLGFATSATVLNLKIQESGVAL